MTTPAEDSETIGVSDNLTPYIKRINSAIAYTGDNDHEDVRSILNALLLAQQQALLESLYGERYMIVMNPKFSIMVVNANSIKEKLISIKSELGEGDK